MAVIETKYERDAAVGSTYEFDRHDTPKMVKIIKGIEARKEIIIRFDLQAENEKKN